jgi:hypothetical protein
MPEGAYGLMLGAVFSTREKADAYAKEHLWHVEIEEAIVDDPEHDCAAGAQAEGGENAE